jgi:hypothetical protein
LTTVKCSVSSLWKSTGIGGIIEGVHSEWAYKNLEAAADGVIDIKLDESTEEARGMMRIRSMRNVGFDAHWYPLRIAAILRGQIIRIAEMKLGQMQRNKAVKMTLEYLEGPEFANSMDGIMQQALTLYEDLKHEVKNHVAVWRKRIAGYQKVYEVASTVKSTTTALLSGEPEYKKLIQTESLPPILELPELENPSPLVRVLGLTAAKKLPLIRERIASMTEGERATVRRDSR